MMNRFLKKSSKTLASICLAATLFAGTGCAKIFPEKYKMRPDKLAVLVIDMQDYWLSEVDEKEIEKELPYHLEVLEYCAKNNITVFVIEYKTCGQTTPYLDNKLRDMHKKEYIKKSARSAFQNTGLEAKLKSQGIDTLVLMGVYASHCVKDTAESALDAGFDIATSKDLISDNRHDAKRKENVEWYKEHGLYFDDYKKLLSSIQPEG
ncbi:cysteine hydrolase [Candidatus Woesearchaeota archaeon]|nr:cysteine hydrolase [Candidatus Woesearchaeota archaeon]